LLTALGNLLLHDRRKESLSESVAKDKEYLLENYEEQLCVRSVEKIFPESL